VLINNVDIISYHELCFNRVKSVFKEEEIIEKRFFIDLTEEVL